MPKLDGKIAVITGGNSGIGLATAKVFVKKARAFTSRAAGRQNSMPPPPFLDRVPRPSRATSPSRLISTASTTRSAVTWDVSTSFSQMPAW